MQLQTDSRVAEFDTQQVAVIQYINQTMLW